MKNKALLRMLVVIFAFTAVVCGINIVHVEKNEVPLNTVRFVKENTQMIEFDALAQDEFEITLQNALGKAFHNECKGVELSTFLTQQGVDLETLDSVRITAEDQYSVTLDQALVLEKRIFLVTHENGKAMENLNGSGNAPRLAVAGDENSQRAVKFVMEIKIEMEEK